MLPPAPSGLLNLLANTLHVWETGQTTADAVAPAIGHFPEGFPDSRGSPMRGCLAWTCLLVLMLSAGQDALAQGLVWNLPPDGTQVRYEGTYEQTIRRPNSTEGDLTLSWRRNLLIKSVGQETVEYDLDGSGSIDQVDAWGLDESAIACRWLEFRVDTGRVVEGIIDAGPGGIRIYKILVPEAAIRGQTDDSEGIFLSHLPIVEGYRKLGDQPTQEMESPVFQLYPVISLIRHFGELTEQPGTQPIDVGGVGTVTASAVKGEMATETGTSRSTNSAEIWHSPEMPFGVVQWSAEAINEQKNPTTPRSAFQESVVLTEELTAVEVSTGAESDLITE
jgi:hypothetical protein